MLSFSTHNTKVLGWYKCQRAVMLYVYFIYIVYILDIGNIALEPNIDFFI